MVCRGVSVKSLHHAAILWLYLESLVEGALNIEP